MEIFPGIWVDAGTRFGKPCLAGTRIDVATVIGALAGGETFEDLERDYRITHEQVLTSLRSRGPRLRGQPAVPKEEPGS